MVSPAPLRRSGPASNELPVPDPAVMEIRPQIRDMPMENIAELAVLARKLEGVIPLWYGEGDLVTPSFIRDAAKQALDDGRTFYIPDMRGDPPLAAALSKYQSDLHGTAIGVERSTVAPSGMQALMIALELIVDVGQNVVYVEPQWPNIRSIIHLVGGEPRAVALDFRDNDWHLDLDKLFAACDARTRAIFLSTPSNPAGWTASRDEMLALLEFSRKRGIWIISDEVYGRLYADGPVAPSMLQIADPEDLVLTVNSFSKAWAMTGWRVGWLTHPSSVAPALAAMTQYINSGTAAFVQAGALAALTQGEALVEEMRSRCRNGLDAGYAALSRIPSAQLPVKPRGGMYVFFSLDGQADSREACRKVLEKARVGLAPGYMFGQASKRFLRMCICRDPAQLQIALERMVDALA